MSKESKAKHSTPVKSKNSKGSPQKHIQVNLSREYFTAMADMKDSHNEDDKQSNNTMKSNIEEKDDDFESDILPISSAGSSPKGIIKNLDSRKQTSFSSGASSTKSPKKVRINEPTQNEKTKNVQSITEMENIRQQLKNVIGQSQLKSQSDLEFPYYTALDSTHLNWEEIKGPWPTVENFEPSGIFRGLLSYTSPPLQTDENDILRGNQFATFGENNLVFPSQQPDGSLVIEISMLKENLEKEEQRRKHCEHQIQNLQKKILEVQQQLAVAVATDKKKAVMIEQLDKTLARVVDGWKKHEADRLSSIERLKKENTMLHKSQNKQQEILAQFESELSHAVESITKEQTRAKVAEEEKQAQVTKHQNEKKEALEMLDKERELVRNLNTTVDNFQQESRIAKEKIESLEGQAAKDRESWMQERSELENELEQTKMQCQENINNLQQSVSSYQKDAQEALSQVTELQHEKQRMDIELDATLREKESLKMEIGLLEAKFEAVKTKQESEQQGKLQEEFNRRINLIQDEIVRTEAELKNTHKEQILELNRKHKEDLERQFKRFQEELSKKDEKLRTIAENLENRFAEAQNEIASLNDSKRDLESQRKELIRRLRALMQQHMQEAVSLISFESDSQSQQRTQSLSKDSFVTQDQFRLFDSHQFHPHENMQSFSSIDKDSQRSLNLANVNNSFNLFQKLDKQNRETKSAILSSDIGKFIQTDARSERNDIINTSTDSVSGPWSKLQQIESPDKPIFGNSIFDANTSTVSQGYTPSIGADSLSNRQERFQSGLQDLSDKLRISAQIGTKGQTSAQTRAHRDLSSPFEQGHSNFGMGDKERPYFQAENREYPASHTGSDSQRNIHLEKPMSSIERSASVTQSRQSTDTWAQVQALLRSKMEEVESDYQTTEDAESTLKEQTIDTAFSSPKSNRNTHEELEEQIRDQGDRQEQLTHFIKQLLNKSPGNPTGDETEDEDEKTFEQKELSRTAKLDTLPLGSDLVSKDSHHEQFKTPPKVSRTSQMSQAFKKSVLKEKPSQSFKETMHIKERKTSMNSGSVSPRKSPRKKFTTEESKKKEQLNYLMKAFGINADASTQDLDGMIRLIQNAQQNSQDKPRNAKPPPTKQNTGKTTRSSIGNQSLKSQPHKQQANKNQKGRPEDVFSRLQRIYGNSEESQGVQRNLENQVKTAGSKQLSRNQGNQSVRGQGSKAKEQRKFTISPRNPNEKLLQAWK